MRADGASRSAFAPSTTAHVRQVTPSPVRAPGQALVRPNPARLPTGSACCIPLGAGRRHVDRSYCWLLHAMRSNAPRRHGPRRSPIVSETTTSDVSDDSSVHVCAMYAHVATHGGRPARQKCEWLASASMLFASDSSLRAAACDDSPRGAPSSYIRAHRSASA